MSSGKVLSHTVEMYNFLSFKIPNLNLRQPDDAARDGLGDGGAGDGPGEGAALLTPQEIAQAAKIWKAYERT